MSTIPEILITAREGKGWTRYRLAKEAEIDDTLLQRIEEGTRGLTLPTALRLARALGASLAIFDTVDLPDRREKES